MKNSADRFEQEKMPSVSVEDDRATLLSDKDVDTSSGEPVDADASNSKTANGHYHVDNVNKEPALQAEEEASNVADGVGDKASKLESKDSNESGSEGALPDVVTVDENYEAEPEEYSTLEEDDTVVNRQSFWPSTQQQWLTTIAFGVVIILGIVLRFWGLGDRPLHFDESQHAYFSRALLLNNLQHWTSCLDPNSAIYGGCYRYDPLLHGPFQFHIMAFVYQIASWLGVPYYGVNTTTARIAAALFGSGIVALPYLLRRRIGVVTAWMACFLLAVSPSMVYFSRFAREDIYMAFFTLLFVVSIACYLGTRKGGWLVLAALAIMFSYTIKEATYLNVAVFGSFLGAIILWEFGSRLRWPWLVAENSFWQRLTPRSAALLFVVGYFVILGVIALLAMGQVNAMAQHIYDFSLQHPRQTEPWLQNLKDTTVHVMPFLGIGLAALVIFILWREGRHYVLDAEGKVVERPSKLVRLIDKKRQPLLYTIATTPWHFWFFALVGAWLVFLILYTSLFTNITNGIGDGIWQGLYYWLGQQPVKRGGQPWYYYILLIPLYEQIGLVFGFVGVIRSLLRPTRFRLFLCYWMLGNIAIYSWAGEKMPWLMIHMTMPMMILAAIGLEPAALFVIRYVQDLLAKRNDSVSEQPVTEEQPAKLAFLQKRSTRLGGSISTIVVALLLLVVTLQNMIQVTYVHEADANHEMMIYVQTTFEMNTVMNKIETLDKQLYGGKHTIPIAITGDINWPLAWYLRDYTNVCYNLFQSCPNMGGVAPVLIAGYEGFSNIQASYGTRYQSHIYHMFDQWDQGYMPPPCKPTPGHTCEAQPYTGIGPLAWLSYGDDKPLPPDAQFSLSSAAQRVWNWWWTRQPIGRADGNGFTMLGLFIRSDLKVKP